MLVHRFDSHNDLQMRLGGSIVRLEGRGVRIIDTRDDLNVVAQDLITHKSRTISSNDDALDISSPPIGYAVGETQPAFLARIPVRRSVQGLVDGNVNVSGDYNGARYALSQISHVSLGQSILGEFPSVEETCRKIRARETHGGPLSRSFAILSTKRSDIFRIRQRGQTIGLLCGKEAILLDEFQDKKLKEELKCIGLEV